MVNATECPCSSCRRIPNSAPTAPRELDPRTGMNPNLDDAGNVLAIKTAAGHHCNLIVAAAVGRRDHATMPESPNGDRALAADVTGAASFGQEGVSQSRANQAD